MGDRMDILVPTGHLYDKVLINTVWHDVIAMSNLAIRIWFF